MADEATKLVEVTLTNICKGDRGVNTPNGTVFIAPGEFATVKITEAEKKSALSTEHFKTGKPRAEKPKEDAEEKAAK